jgi:GR25 family glycosyltransferase involved in LPS biosynthesis
MRRSFLYFIGVILIFILICILGKKTCENIHIPSPTPSTTNDINEFCKLIPKVLYINLDSRQDRNKQFISNFSVQSRQQPVNGFWDKDEPNVDVVGGCGLERISAVLNTTDGAIGCLQSHIKALKHAQTLNVPYILICEDDFYIPNMKYAVDSIKKFFENFDKWNVLMLGQNTSDKTSTKIENIIKVNASFTCSGYLIKKDYISALLSIYERDLKKYEETKKWDGDYRTDVSWKVLQVKDLWYSFSPTIGIQRKSYSDIQRGVMDYGV